MPKKWNFKAAPFYHKTSHWALAECQALALATGLRSTAFLRLRAHGEFHCTRIGELLLMGVLFFPVFT